MVQKVGGSPSLAISRAFEKFPHVSRRIEESKKLFIKINAVYFHKHLHTSLPLIESVLAFVRKFDPKKQIYLMENCSQGNFTRHCFSAIGIDALAKPHGVRCLYLDEEKSVQVEVGEGSTAHTVRFPKILYENLVVDRAGSFYLNMPVLKAHCQTQMTAGIKNQMGLLYDIDKAKNHNYLLHQKLVDILKFIRPDFVLVDALKVVARGPIPPAKFIEGNLYEKDVIVGGEDTVAVDAVCAKMMGYEPESIKHVALAARQGLGTADLASIELEGELPPCAEKVPWELERHFPGALKFIVGSKRACYEGCLGHAEQIVELLVNENNSPANFSDIPLTVITGSGFRPEQLDELEEPIILLGKCACDELQETLYKRYIGIDALNTCGRCDNIIAVFARNLGADLFNLSPLSRLEIYRQLLLGRFRGLRYAMPR